MTGFREIWVEAIRQVHAEISDREIIRITTPDGTAVWATCVILDIIMPANSVRGLTVCGITESGERVEEKFREDADDYPPEIVPLIPELVSFSEILRAPDTAPGCS